MKAIVKIVLGKDTAEDNYNAAAAELLPRLAPHTLVICLSLNATPELAAMLTGLAQAAMEVRWSCARPQDFPGRLSRTARTAARHPADLPPGLLAPFLLRPAT